MGLSSGLIVFILGITGCILAFVDELKPIVYQSHYAVQPVDTVAQQQSLSTLFHAAEQHWGKDKPVSAVEIENDALRTWHFRAYSEDDNSGMWYWDEKKYYESFFINPYTAAKVYSEDAEFEFFRVILYLHWSLLFKTAIGQPIVGVATLFFVVLILTGLYLWWPKNKKARRVRFWFRWKNDIGTKRKNYDLHNILGFYSFVLALLLGLTGLIWAFSWFDESVQNLLNKIGGDKPKVEVQQSSLLSKDSTVPFYDRVYHDVQQEYPKAAGYYFYFPQEGREVLNVYIRTEKRYTSIIRQYNTSTETLVNIIDFASKDNGQKMRDLNYDIHLGSILGIPGKIVVFLASFVAASLPVTGFFIWRNRRKKNKKKFR